MKNVLVLTLAVWMFFSGAGIVLAQDTEVFDVPSTRFGLFVEHWKDKLSLWKERDGAKKAELEAKIAEKYQTWADRVNDLPDSANKEIILQTMEARKEQFTARLEQRIVKKEEIRNRFEVRLNELKGKGETVRERVENRATGSAELREARDDFREERGEIMEENEQGRKGR